MDIFADEAWQTLLRMKMRSAEESDSSGTPNVPSADGTKWLASGTHPINGTFKVLSRQPMIVSTTLRL
jgi:hypothetical protein